MSSKDKLLGVQNFGSIGTVGAAIAQNAALTSPASNAVALASAAQSGLTIGVANSSLSIAGLVHAMESDGDANVLSTPNLLTMDNEEAEIIVGQNVPFITGTSSSTGTANANPFQTIERKDIGLTLKVKPQISEGNTVRLELYQEMSSIDQTQGVQGADLITNKRSIKTVVLANDGEMIVLGGLMRDDVTDLTQRVPCLGSMPIIGEAFQFTSNQRTKTNLMVFLRPHIVDDASDLQSITNIKYNEIRGLYENPTSSGSMIFPKRAQNLPKDLSPEASKNLKLEEEIQSNVETVE